MRNKQLFNYLVFIFFLLFVPLLVNRAVRAKPDEPNETEAVSSGYAPNWNAFQPITTLDGANSASSEGAAQAVVASAPDGSTVMVAFDRKRPGDVNGNRDPYYRVSTNNGASWAAIQPIKKSANNSASVDIAYDSGSKAHAVWIENDTLIYYSRQLGGVWTPIKIINSLNPPDPQIVLSPQIFTTGSSTIDIVWVQENANPPGPGTNVFHARSEDGGTSWIATTTDDQLIESTSAISATPALFVQGDTIHVVRAEADANGKKSNGDAFVSSQDIYYTFSTDGGETWKKKINISDFDNDNEVDGDPTDGRVPNITVANNIVQVAFVELRDEDTSLQFVHYVSCSLDNDCSKISNWSANGIISGQAVGANNSAPYNVLAGITTINNCTLIYFHGTFLGVNTVKEQLFGTSSCGGGAWVDRETLTQADVQTLRPHLATQNNWWVYMAFEQVKDGKSQIWFLRNQPVLYLPFISR